MASIPDPRDSYDVREAEVASLLRQFMDDLERDWLDRTGYCCDAKVLVNDALSRIRHEDKVAQALELKAVRRARREARR